MLNNILKRSWSLIAIIALFFSILPTATSTVQAQESLTPGRHIGGLPAETWIWGKDRINQRNLPFDGNDDIYIRKHIPDDPNTPQNESEQNIPLTGAGVHVFILDSGININHQEFDGGRIGTGSRNFVPQNETLPVSTTNTVDPNNINDCNGHGTGTASIIGGKTRGIAPNVNLHIVRVYGCERGSPQYQLDGINYVANTIQAWRNGTLPDGSKWNEPVMVVLNLGGTPRFDNNDPSYYDQYLGAVNNLTNNVGVPTFNSAHNYNVNACGPYGANAGIANGANVITTGGINSRDQRSRTLNHEFIPAKPDPNWSHNGSGTSWGRCVDLFAPYDGGYVAAINSVDCYTTEQGADTTGHCSSYSFGGSSAANPHAAGIGALWLEQNPGYGQSAAGAVTLEFDMIKAATKGVLHNPRSRALEGSAKDLNDVANLGPGSPNRLLYASPVGPEENLWGSLTRYVASNGRHWVNTLPLGTGLEPFKSGLSFTEEGNWELAEGSVVDVLDPNVELGVRQPWLPEGDDKDANGVAFPFFERTQPLYGCIVYDPADPEGTAYMMPSTNPDCEALPNNHPNANYRHMQLGHIYTTAHEAASLPMYRCKRTDLQDHYISPHSNCENAGVAEGPPLGFVNPVGIPINPAKLHVNSTSPQNYTVVPRHAPAPPSIAFNKPINPSTLSPQTVQVLANGSSTNLVNGISFDAATNIATLQLNSALADGNYTIMVDSSVEDSFGKPLGQAYQSTFQVGHASTVNWINPEGGYWHEPENWSTGVVPGPNDFAVIDFPATTPITINQGTHPVAGIWSSAWITMTGGTLDVSQSALFSALTLNGGTLRSTGPMEMRNVFNWGGGVLEGSGSSLVPPGGTMVIDRYSKYLRYGHRLMTQGTTVWVNNNHIYMNDGATWENYGTFTIDTDYDLNAWSGAPSKFINHSGAVLRKNSGTTTTFSGLHFENAGTLDLQNGEFQLSGTITHTGKVLGTTAGQLYMSSGSHTFTQHSSLTVVGVKVSGGNVQVDGLFAPSAQLTQNGGTLVVNGHVGTLTAPVLVEGGTFTLNSPTTALSMTFNGGTFNGTGTLNVFDMAWGGGTMDDAGRTEVSGSLTLNRYSKYLRYGRQLVVHGNTFWSGNNHLYLNDGATWENYGTFTIDTDYDLNAWSGAPSKFINHSGAVLRKNSGTTTTFSGLHFTNAGTLDLQNGEFQLSGTVTHTGNIQGSTAGQLYMSAGDQTLAASSSLTDVGVRVSGGNVQVDGSFAPNAQFTQNGGTLTLNGTVGTLNAPVLVEGGTLTLNSPTTALSVTFNGGTVNGTGALNMTDFTWGGGTLDGTGRTEVSGNLTLNRYSKYLRYGRQLVVQGDTLWSGNNHLYLNDGATWENYGTFTINTDYDLNAWSGAPSSFINGSGGVLRKVGGTATTTFSGMHFTNAGTLDIQNGEFQLSGTVTHTGNIQGSAAGQLYMSSGNYVFDGSSSLANVGLKVTGGTFQIDGSFAPSGPLTVSGGTLILNGTSSVLNAPVLVTGGTLTLNSPTTALSVTLNGGTVNGTGALNVTDFTWGGGTLDGTGRTEVNGNLTLNRYSKYLRYGRQLVVQGDTLWSGNNHLYLNDGATWENYGTFTINTDYDLNAWSGAPSSFINGSGGVLRKVGGTATTTFSGMHFTNAGTLDIQNGEFQLSGTVTHTGNIQGSTAGQLYMSSGDQTLAASSSLTGVGVRVSGGNVEVDGSFTPSAQLTQNGGTLTLNGTVGTLNAPVLVQGGTLTLNSPTTALSMTLNGGTLNGTGTLNVTNMAWGGGTMDDAGRTNVSGSLTLNRYSKYLRYGRQLVVQGNTLWSGNNHLYMNDGATWENYGTFTINTDYDMSAWSGDPSTFINHSGAILRKIGGTATTTFSGMTFTNNGTIDVQAGTLDLPE